MRLFDLALAGAGRVAASIRARGPWVTRAVIGGLLAGTLIPVMILFALTRVPTEVTFADLKAGFLPPMTSWLRLEGELRPVPEDVQPASGDVPYVYTLSDPTNDQLAVSVESDAPLETGHTQVTGQVSGAGSVPGTVATITADVPTEPIRHDPWLLLALPAILAIPVVVGLRTGYPVVRGDPPAPYRAGPLRLDESLAARWSGRIGSESAPRDAMRPCTITVTTDVDVCQVIVADAATARTIATRRASPKRRLRVCWTDGCKPALEIHAPAADLLLTFHEVIDRERFAATLQ